MVRTHWTRWSLVAAMVLLVPATSWSQAIFRIQKDQPPLPIDQATVNAVIDQALKRLDDEYVFPDVATRIAKTLRKHQADKEYAGIKTGQELAERLTKDLQAVSKDKHLRIMCSAEKLQEPPAHFARNKMPPQMKQEMDRMGQWMNGGYSKVQRLPGNIGYLKVDFFPFVESAIEPAAAAMNFLANTDALIIDVRQNHGGVPESVALLCSYFFDNKPVHLNDLYFRKGNRTDESWTRKDVAGRRYLGKDVYILTSSHTFSGGEEFVYDMQTQKRAIIVGETTGGGAHPGKMAPIGDHFGMFVPGGRAINPITKTDWEGTGVKPDIAVPAGEALAKARSLAIKKQLDKAKDDRTRRLIEGDLELSRDLESEKSTKRDR
jgi:retinol-binding protein 3